MSTGEERVKIVGTRRRPGGAALYLGFALFGCLCVGAATASLPVTNIGAARLTTVAAPTPVRLRGVVTGFSGWQNSFFLQDNTGAISIDRLDNTTVEQGEEVEVTGELRPGLYAPIVQSRQIQSLGRAKLLDAPETTYAQMAGGRFDSKIVQVTGIVHSAHTAEIWGRQVLLVDLQTSGGSISVHVLHYPGHGFDHLVDSTVRVRGVCGTIFNNRQELVGLRLFTSDLNQISVIEPGIDASRLPLSPLAALGKFNGPSSDHRVKVAGTVTFQSSPNEFYLQQADSAIRVQTASAGTWPIGLQVNVAGFLAGSGGFLRSLRDAQVERLAMGGTPSPASISATDVIKTENGFPQTPYVGRLVRIKARILERLPNTATQLWAVVSGNVQFQVQLAEKAQRDSVVLEADSEVSLTGICLIDEDEAHNPSSFRIVLRSSNDISTLNAAYWSSSLVLLIIILSLILVGSLTTWLFQSRRREAQFNELADATTLSLRRNFRRASRVMAGTGIVLGALVVLGWLADIRILQIRDSQLPMMPNAALGILTASMAVWLVATKRSSFSIVTFSGAAVSAIIGSLTLAEYIAPIHLQLDLLLVRNAERFHGSVDPGRMVLAAALCFLLTGCAIALTAFRRGTGFGQVLSVAVGVIGLLNLIDRIYGDQSRYGTGAHTTMAVPTALALLVVSLANLFARPDCGLMSTVSLSGSGGMMARRLFPVALLAPVTLGWIRLQGQTAGLYGTRFGLALFALSNVVCFGFVVWSSAAALNRLDRARSSAEKTITDRDIRLERVFQTASIGDWSWDVVRDEVTAHPVVWKLYGAPDHTGSEPSKWFRERQHPDDHEMIASKQNAALRDKTLLDVEFRVIQPDGIVRWNCTRGNLVIGPSGELLRVDGISFDVTDQKNAETQLQRSEERFRQLADAMPQIVWTAAPDGAVLYFNKRWYEYTGLTFDSPWSKFVHAEDLPTVEKAWMRSMMDGSPYELEVRLKRARDGVYRWHLARAIPVRNPSGAIEQWFGTSTDIDDFKQAGYELQALNQTLENRVQERSAQLAETERRYRLLVEGVQDYAIYMLDPDGTVATWSIGAERLSGYQSSEVLGKHFSMFYRADDAAQEVPKHQLELAVAEGQIRTEGWRRRKDGSAFWGSILITAMQEDRQNRGFSIIIRDLTEQKRAEALIISEGKRAEEANRAKSSFLAAMSHEIRTPMNAILGMADLLWETQLDVLQREYVGRFRRAGTNLLALINDILDLSKIESGKFELESVDFDLWDLLDRTIELMAPRARAKGIELASLIVPGTPRFLIGDPSRVQQILNNLIGNAVKFTEKGSVVVATSLHSSNTPGHVQFAVKDTGIGVPRDKLKSIFEDFTQAESSTTRRFGGTGLGLGICRRLVSRMGGELRVESVFGQGSTFLFDVVLSPSQCGMEAEDKEIGDLSGSRVLIVDDNSANRLIVNQMCTSWGMETSETKSASQAQDMVREALKSAQGPPASRHPGKELAGSLGGALESGPVVREWLNNPRPFSLVLLDRVLPEVSGFETLQNLRKLDPNLPIIVISSDDRPGDITAAKAAGAAAYMTKPIRGAQLLHLISKVLRERRSHHDQTESSEDSQVELKMLRILVAEDSEDNRFLMSAYLKNRPYQLTFAPNGQEALAIFKNEDFDLIFMDIQMPVMDGLTATARIRDMERRYSSTPTPIVALTANALVEDTEKSRAAGCDAHLSKPISKDKLIATIESFRNFSRQEAEIPAADPEPKPNYRITIPSGFEDLSRKYIAARQKDVARFMTLGAGQSMDELRSFGHNMKGTGISFGFPELTNLGAAIESAAKESKSAEIAQHLAKLSEYVEYASQALS